MNKFQQYCVKKHTSLRTQLCSTSAATAGKRRGGTLPLLAGSHHSSWNPWAEAREPSARQSSEKTPQLPAILVCSRSESFSWTNGLQNPAIPFLKIPFFKTNKQKKTCKQDECFWLKDQKHSSITREEFFPQYIPNKESVASLPVASHTSSHAAHTTSCTSLQEKFNLRTRCSP